jgi:hypothetical protein
MVVMMMSPLKGSVYGGIETTALAPKSLVHNIALLPVYNAENTKIMALAGFLRSGEEAKSRVDYQFADNLIVANNQKEANIANMVKKNAKRLYDGSPSILLSLFLADDIVKLKPASANMVNSGEAWATASKIPRMKKTNERNEEKAMPAAHVFMRCLAA